MDGSGEDRISNLPDSVVCHILSRLAAKDAVRTSILSKDWEHKWTSMYKIHIDDESTSKIKSRPFVRFVNRALELTRNSRIKSFRIKCHRALCSHNLKRWISVVLMRHVQNLEIKTHQCGDITFGDDIYNCRTLTELKLSLNCTLTTPRIKNCFPNLKILCLGDGVKILNEEIYNAGRVVLNFPALKELELRCCMWRGVKTVEINAPALIRLLAEGPYESLWNYYLIKIDGAKLEKFESCGGILENVVFTATSVLNASLTSFLGGANLKLRARKILKEFPALEHLKLSSEIVEALVESNTVFPRPYFNRLKQLELYTNISDEALLKLLKVMPSLESLFLNVYSNKDKKYGGLESFPSGIASRLKVVKLLGFGGAIGELHLANGVLKNVENLEKLIVSVCCEPLMSKTGIERRLSTFTRSSTRASVVVTEEGHNLFLPLSTPAPAPAPLPPMHLDF